MYPGNQTIQSIGKMPQGATMVDGGLDNGDSKIRNEVSACEQILSELHAVIEAFEHRIETVLMPIPPQGLAGASPTPQGPTKSHLLGRVQLLNEGYTHAIVRLNALRQRVEI